MRTPSISLAVRTLILAAAAAGLAAAPALARANCARPVGYDVAITGSTVIIQPVAFDGRGCPAAGGMLRQNAGTGETVRLADFCGPAGTDPDLGLPYADECVGPGTYRYGFAVPFTCVPGACATDYFATATVTAPFDPGCARSAGNAAPTASGAPPWGDQQAVCTYGVGGGGCATLPSGSGTVLLLDGAALALGLALLRRRRRR